MALSEEEAVAKIGEHSVLLVRGMFIQVVMDTFLAGFYTRQLWTYYENMRGDSKWLKALVLWIAIVSYSNSAFIMWWTAKLFIHNYGMYASFLDAATLGWFPLLDGVLGGCVQLFFSYRVYRLNGSKSIIVMLAASGLILASISSAITTKVVWTIRPDILTRPGIWAPMLVWLNGIMAANIIITIGTFIPLFRAGAYKRNHIVMRIFHYTMQTQLICTLMSIAYLLQYLAIPSAFVGATFLGIQAKFYSTGMMYTINSRLVLPGTTDGQHPPASTSHVASPSLHGTGLGTGTRASNGHLGYGMANLAGRVRRSFQDQNISEVSVGNEYGPDTKAAGSDLDLKSLPATETPLGGSGSGSGSETKGGSEGSEKSCSIAEVGAQEEKRSPSVAEVKADT